MCLVARVQHIGIECCVRDKAKCTFQYLFSLKRQRTRFVGYFLLFWSLVFGVHLLCVCATQNEPNKQNKKRQTKNDRETCIETNVYHISECLFFELFAHTRHTKWLNEMLCMKAIYRSNCKWMSAMCARVSIESVFFFFSLSNAKAACCVCVCVAFLRLFHFGVFFMLVFLYQNLSVCIPLTCLFVWRWWRWPVNNNRKFMVSFMACHCRGYNPQISMLNA